MLMRRMLLNPPSTLPPTRRQVLPVTSRHVHARRHGQRTLAHALPKTGPRKGEAQRGLALSGDQVFPASDRRASPTPSPSTLRETTTSLLFLPRDPEDTRGPYAGTDAAGAHPTARALDPEPEPSGADRYSDHRARASRQRVALHIAAYALHAGVVVVVAAAPHAPLEDGVVAVIVVEAVLVVLLVVRVCVAVAVGVTVEFVVRLDLVFGVVGRVVVFRCDKLAQDSCLSCWNSIKKDVLLAEGRTILVLFVFVEIIFVLLAAEEERGFLVAVKH